jgi:ABC-type phosphate transport system substrate-binding protein
MRTSLLPSVLLVILVGCDALDQSSTKQPAPIKQDTTDADRITISGSSTGAEGESINLTAKVTNARGKLQYDWSLSGRGSLMSREADPEKAVVIGSSPGRLLVTVTVSEDGVEIGSASLTLRITD